MKSPVQTYLNDFFCARLNDETEIEANYGKADAKRACKMDPDELLFDTIRSSKWVYINMVEKSHLVGHFRRPRSSSLEKSLLMKVFPVSGSSLNLKKLHYYLLFTTPVQVQIPRQRLSIRKQYERWNYYLSSHFHFIRLHLDSTQFTRMESVQVKASLDKASATTEKVSAEAESCTRSGRLLSKPCRARGELEEKAKILERSVVVWFEAWVLILPDERLCKKSPT